MNRLLATTASSLGSALLLTLAPPAQAAGWDHLDRQGDVLVRDLRSDGYTDPRVDNDETEADMRRVNVDHDSATLRVATGLRSLDSSDSVWRVRVETSKGEVYSFGRSATTSDGSVAAFFARKGTRGATCEGLVVRRTPNAVVATVPRSCLGTPYRLRVGIQAQSVRPVVGEAVEERISVDDALRTGRYTDGMPQMSPWIAGAPADE